MASGSGQGGRCAVVARTVDVDARPTLATLVDRLRDKAPGAVIALGAKLTGGGRDCTTGPNLKGTLDSMPVNLSRRLPVNWTTGWWST